VQRDGEDAGQRADAEGPDEDQREDDLRHGARRFQQAARADRKPARRAEVAGGREGEQQPGGSAHQRGEGGHLRRLEQQHRPGVGR
jgi:hypothetical protein